LKRNKQHG